MFAELREPTPNDGNSARTVEFLDRPLNRCLTFRGDAKLMREKMIRDAIKNFMIGGSKLASQMLASQMLASDNNFQPSFVLDRSIPIKVMKMLIVSDANKI